MYVCYITLLSFPFYLAFSSLAVLLLVIVAHTDNYTVRVSLYKFV